MIDLPDDLHDELQRMINDIRADQMRVRNRDALLSCGLAGAIFLDLWEHMHETKQ